MLVVVLVANCPRKELCCDARWQGTASPFPLPSIVDAYHFE
jgi:hypothetical protein